MIDLVFCLITCMVGFFMIGAAVFVIRACEICMLLHNFRVEWVLLVAKG